MVDVAREETAEISGILAGASTATFMQQELDAVNIPKNFWRSRSLRAFGELKLLQFFGSAIAVEADQFRDMATVNLRSGEAQFFFERLLQDGKIPVFAEN